MARYSDLAIRVIPGSKAETIYTAGYHQEWQRAMIVSCGPPVLHSTPSRLPAMLVLPVTTPEYEKNAMRKAAGRSFSITGIVSCPVLPCSVLSGSGHPEGE